MKAWHELKKKNYVLHLLVGSISMYQNPWTHQLTQTQKNLKTSPDSAQLIRPKSLMVFQFGSSHPGGFLDNPSGNVCFSLLTWLRLFYQMWLTKGPRRGQMVYPGHSSNKFGHALGLKIKLEFVETFRKAYKMLKLCIFFFFWETSIYCYSFLLFNL